MATATTTDFWIPGALISLLFLFCKQRVFSLSESTRHMGSLGSSSFCHVGVEEYYGGIH